MLSFAIFAALISFLFQITISGTVMFMLWQAHKKYNIKITIHNIPIIIFFMLGLLGCAILYVLHFGIYWLIGLILGILSFVLSSVSLPNHPTEKYSNKFLVSFIYLLFWPQVIVVSIFYLMYAKKLENYEKPQS